MARAPTPVHIVHLSSASSLDIVRTARARGLPLTVETCPHYLTFAAEEISDGATEYKCAPPIRDEAERDALWEALIAGDIDLVASDHSPCPPEMKQTEGDFFSAWGGIASLQLSLSAVWTGARGRGVKPERIAQWMSAAPARLAGQGEVAIGVVFSHDTVAAIEEGFKDLKVVFPSEGTGYEVGGEALVKNAPDPVAGKTFLDWALGVKAQELAATFKAYQIPTNPDAKVSDKSVKLASVKTVSYDFQWAGENKKALVDRFSNEVAPAPR
jgi:hypothetical protein